MDLSEVKEQEAERKSFKTCTHQHIYYYNDDIDER
jgi:hypothetical protein